GALRIGSVEAELPEPNAPGCQRLPGDAIGREFLVTDRHLVALGPIQSHGDNGQGLGGVLDQSNIALAGCVEQRLQLTLQAVFQLDPAGIVPGALVQVLAGEGFHRLGGPFGPGRHRDRKSTRLNSSHVKISYAVFCLKKKHKLANGSPYFPRAFYSHPSYGRIGRRQARPPLFPYTTLFRSPGALSSVCS